MAVGLNIFPFLVFDPVCDLDEGALGSDVGCMVGYLGYGVCCLGCFSDSLDDLVVVKFLL